MIWRNIKALETKIANNELTDREGFNYFLFYFIIMAIPFGSIGKAESPPVWINVVSYVLIIFFNYWGLSKTFEINNQIDGKDFFKRFFALLCVNFVSLVRIIFLYSCFIVMTMVVLHFGWDINFADYKLITQIFGLFNSIAIQLLFYYKLIRSFNNIKTLISRQVAET
jgi:hypothetical protein